MFGHFTNYNALYGSIGAILAVQLWIYFNMIAILVGYELNTSIARARSCTGHGWRSDPIQPFRIPSGPCPESGSTMRPILLLCAFSLACSLPAQRYDDQHPPNTYRNADNPYYWKNRPPYEGYWQQDVHYLIKARMDDELDAIDGELTLYYHNNSPDTLRYVFFHLYQKLM